VEIVEMLFEGGARNESITFCVGSAGVGASDEPNADVLITLAVDMVAPLLGTPRNANDDDDDDAAAPADDDDGAPDDVAPPVLIT
jgi:hypothetical protein